MIDTIKKIAGKGQERQETTFHVRLEGNMANITLPYGKENKTVCIPDERLRGTLVSRSEERRVGKAHDRITSSERTCEGKRQHRPDRK
mgnify:CR=1 FL=1